MTLSLYAIGFSLSSYGSVCGPGNRLEVDAFFCHFVQRTHFAETADLLHHEVGDEVDFLFRGELAETEADRAMGRLFGAHRPENIGWLEGRGGAGGARRARDVLDRHQDPFAFDVFEREVQVSRQAVLEASVQVHEVELAADLVSHPLAQLE